MRVLVTGAAGFIGSHLVDHLLALGHEVVGLDRLDETASYGHLTDAQRCHDFTQVWHDLRSSLRPTALGLRPLFERLDWVCHLAASSHVDRSVRDPAQFVDDNVRGTVNLLEWAREHQPDLKKLLYFSTDEVFGPADEGQVFTEHDRHWPNNPYAATKAAAEQMCPAWANTYGLPIVVTHCTNIYGPRQHYEKFIPLVRRALLADKTVQIHSRHTVVSSRYYVHVSDVCRAVVAVLEQGGVIGSDSTGKYNITGVEELSNLEVARRIAASLGKELRYELVDFVPNRPKHDQRYAVGGPELYRLGWKQEVTFDQGLADTLDWYRENDP